MSTTTTNIAGEDFLWLVECLEIQADELTADADDYARTANEAEARDGHPHEEHEQAAMVKRDEAERTWRLHAILAAGASITIHGEQA